jgi:HEAT repeat protein
MLRHFAGRDSQAGCVKALETLLSSSDQDVRATAVLTLGDFGQPDVQIRDRLTAMAEEDASASVREAAAATLSRWATVVK